MSYNYTDMDVEPPPRSNSEILIEQARNACPVHGEENARLFEAGFAVQDYQSRFPDATFEDLYARAEGNPYMQEWIWKLERTDVVHGILNGSIQLAKSVTGLLRDQKTNPINSTARKLAEELMQAYIGDRVNPDGGTYLLDGNDIRSLAIQLSFYVASRTWSLQQSGRDVAPEIESSIINQFASYLTAWSDKTKICGGLGATNEAVDASLQQQVAQLTQAYRALYGNHDINPGFLEHKLRTLLLNNEQTRIFVNLMQSMPAIDEHELTQHETLKEISDTTTTLARQAQRIRRYGVKPLVFDSDDVVPGTDMVLHGPELFRSQIKGGDQPLAYVRIIPKGEEPTIAVDPGIVPTLDHPGLMQYHLRGPTMLCVNHQGELFLGAKPTQGMPLRELFEAEGHLAHYEMLRAHMVQMVFDAIAPAIVVDEITRQVATPATRGTSTPENVTPTDVVHRLLLPRIQYMRRHKPRDLESMFSQEQPDITAHIARLVREHRVAAFLRKLPPSARASRDAIRLSKEEWGEDFELPEGFTFVKSHQRGSEALGRVVGYAAIARSSDT